MGQNNTPGRPSHGAGHIEPYREVESYREGRRRGDASLMRPLAAAPDALISHNRVIGSFGFAPATAKEHFGVRLRLVHEAMHNAARDEDAARSGLSEEPIRLTRLISWVRTEIAMMQGMMDMGGGMMWAMGVVWLLVLALVILGIAALIKYLRF